jgi:hypothetical protein
MARMEWVEWAVWDVAWAVWVAVVMAGKSLERVWPCGKAMRPQMTKSECAKVKWRKA